MLSVESTQKKLKDHGLDGWLMYDFRGSNRLALDLLGIAPDAHMTRRFFYFIPVEGEPVAFVHAIEKNNFSRLPGCQITFSSWQELVQLLEAHLGKLNRIAMEYSPQAGLPYVSLVDGGTIELIRGLGVEVCSSAVLTLRQLTSQQQDSHRAAAEIAAVAIERAWHWIAVHLAADSPINEFDVQDFLLGEFVASQCETEFAPIVAVNGNAANPHYAPTEARSDPIKNGDWILIDLWCRQIENGAVYADLTKVGVIGRAPNEREKEIFEIVRQARDAAIDLLRSGQSLQGWQIDRACREVIEAAGYGEYFVHRTGHAIDHDLHGRGTHMDDYETHDTRPILPGTCFSIEPGIYLPEEFGVRLECDVLITLEGEVEVTGRPQDEIAIVKNN